MAVWSQATLSGITIFDRCDGEYFLPAYIKNENELAQIDTTPLPTMFHVSDGNHLSVSKHFSNDVGIPYFRGQDINDFFLENAYPIMIPEKVFSTPMMTRSHFYVGDVLLSIVGTIGSLSIVPESLGPATGSCKIAILRSKGYYSPFVLAAFLLSRFGQLQIRRNTRGAVQMGLILKDLVRVHVPIFEETAANQIEHLVKQAIEANRKSKTAYTQAQHLLESELGLDKLSFQKPVGYTARFSEIMSEKRANAEYFSPFVKQLLSLNFFKGAKSLATYFSILRGKTPTSYQKHGVAILKTKAIRTPSIDLDRANDFAQIDTGLTEIQEGDLILASMGVGSLGRLSYVYQLPGKFAVDGTLRVLRRKVDTPENIEVPQMLFLSSKAGQELIYRGIVGSTGIISLPDSYLRRIPLPEIDQTLRRELTCLVRSSIEAKNSAKHLLLTAKTRVEQLIEEAATR
jgi:type I restriction enzyme, S subunit